MITRDEQYNSEEGVIHLSLAFGVSECEIIDMIENGLAFQYKGNPTQKMVELVDELRATFDCY